MEIKEIEIKRLKPYKNNAKKHTKKQVEKISESIKEFGFTQPVLIDDNFCVVAGHGRILGAKKAGLTKVPVVFLSDLTEEQIKAYRLVDNKLNESEWDFGLMDKSISEIVKIDLGIFGFENFLKDEELEVMMKQLAPTDSKKKFFVIAHCNNKKEQLSVQKEIEQMGIKCDIKDK